MGDAILRQRENAQRFKVRALFMVFLHWCLHLYEGLSALQGR